MPRRIGFKPRARIRRTQFVDNLGRPLRNKDGRLDIETTVVRRKDHRTTKFNYKRDPRIWEAMRKTGSGTKVRVREEEPFEKTLKKFKKRVKKQAMKRRDPWG